ncbi:MAG TPA: hypothetical protein VIJ66_06765 [Solirubrobacteraceae bacterium]
MLKPTAKVTILLVSVMVAAGCGGQSNAASPKNNSHPSSAAALRRSSSALLVTGSGQPGPAWKPVASIGGQPAAWTALRSGVTLLRFDQRLVHLALHAGSGEPEGRGWTYGDRIGTSEIHRILAAFNGGFKFNYGSVGFVADGRAAVPLKAGLGSIVTYSNGTTDIGAWQEGVPADGLRVASVLQNLHLLVEHGVAAPTVHDCIEGCWGGTLGGGPYVARSALGITSEGQLVWAAGENLSPSTIAQALVDAGVVRAVELDINPEWVAGYLYLHHGAGPTGVPVVPGQLGVPGRFLTPYSRDFFTILANN